MTLINQAECTWIATNMFSNLCILMQPDSCSPTNAQLQKIDKNRTHEMKPRKTFCLFIDYKLLFSKIVFRWMFAEERWRWVTHSVCQVPGLPTTWLSTWSLDSWAWLHSATGEVERLPFFSKGSTSHPSNPMPGSNTIYYQPDFGEIQDDFQSDTKIEDSNAYHVQ